MEHAENAVNLLTEEWINEKPRVATELSNAINNLMNTTT